MAAPADVAQADKKQHDSIGVTVDLDAVLARYVSSISADEVFAKGIDLDASVSSKDMLTFLRVVQHARFDSQRIVVGGSNRSNCLILPPGFLFDHSNEDLRVVEIRKIVVPLQNADGHWSMLVVHFPKRRLEYYDPCFSVEQQSGFPDCPVAKTIPSFVESLGSDGDFAS
eukprot:ANDGO_01331.mRNA.1 hypothetical protein